MEKIIFYLNKTDDFTKNLPKNMDKMDVDNYIKLRTNFSWSLQTYLRLKAENFPCILSNIMPDKGIVIAFRGSLPFTLKPSPKLLLVCLLGDAGSHPWAQLHVVQNPRQTLTIRDSYHIPHWPQPWLITRNSEREEQFENIAYFGDLSNLASELRCLSWQERVNSIGLNWQVMGADRFYDYSNVDAIVAVRSFDGRDYIHKPASKLYNAWHAGVPAILGHESAYQAERRSKLDYIEVSSPNEVISALKRLRDDKGLRKAMIENGHLRAQETSFTNLVARWRDFITQTAEPAYEHWCAASSLSRQSFFVQRFLTLRINGIKHRMSSFRG